MKLSELMKFNATKKYRYVGTIWGDTSFEMTGAKIADMLMNQLPDFDGEIGEHPANEQRTYDSSEDGHYYGQSNCIAYVGHLIDEIILEEIPDAHASAVALGRKGGSARTQAKQDASRTNGKLGGRPKKRK